MCGDFRFDSLAAFLGRAFGHDPGNLVEERRIVLRGGGTTVLQPQLRRGLRRLCVQVENNFHVVANKSERRSDYAPDPCGLQRLEMVIDVGLQPARVRRA